MKKSTESEIWCQLSGWPGVNCLVSFWASVSSHLKWMRFFSPFFSFPVSSSLHPLGYIQFSPSPVIPPAYFLISSKFYFLTFPSLSPFLIFLLSFSLISFLLSYLLPLLPRFSFPLPFFPTGSMPVSVFSYLMPVIWNCSRTWRKRFKFLYI